MNVRNLLLTALVASMALVSCDKSENDVSVPTDKSLKSVTVKLPNIKKAVGSRAVGNVINDGTKVSLNNYKVFFLDVDGNPVTIPNYDADGDGTPEAQKVFFSTADGTDWNQYIGEGKEFTYHFLPFKTAKVVVVGNCGDKSYDDIKEATYDVHNDGDTGVETDTDNHPLYPLYGVATLVRSANATDNEDHENVYTATVNLLPAIARMEVYGFEYKSVQGETPSYDNLTFDKLALSNYYKQYKVTVDLANETANSSLVNDPVPAPAAHAEVWTWIEEASAPWADGFTNYSLKPDDKLYQNGQTIDANDTDGSNAGSAFTYCLAAGAYSPELFLAFYGNKGGSSDPLFLNAKFTQSIPTVEAGKIYRVLFSFEDDAWEQPERCVELTVTVAEWDVVPVTPEF